MKERDDLLKELEPRLKAIVESALKNHGFTPVREKQQTILPYLDKKPHERDWILYEASCRREKIMFFKILKYAVDYLNIKHNYCGNGRPNAFIDDIIKSHCIRLYSNYSSWRCESELEFARSLGIIEQVYKRSTLLKYLKSPLVTSKLNELYKLIASPIAPIESHLLADASGIGQAYACKRWVEVRDKPEQWRYYRKLHILSGAKTKIVVSCKITEGKCHESPFLPELINERPKEFCPRYISADAGFLSKSNVKAISKAGAIAFIKPKKNVSIPSRGISSAWGSMLRLWKENQDLFAQYYHVRSNVESFFSQYKRKFGFTCRAKSPVSQENEILSKIVCHNAVILARAMVEFNLDVKFMAS